MQRQAAWATINRILDKAAKNMNHASEDEFDARRWETQDGSGPSPAGRIRAVLDTNVLVRCTKNASGQTGLRARKRLTTLLARDQRGAAPRVIRSPRITDFEGPAADSA